MVATLVPQDGMRGLLRRHELNALVSQRPQINPFEEPFSPAEQNRRDGKVQFINQALTQVLPDGVRPTADPHVLSRCRFACAVERLGNASVMKWKVVPPSISMGGRG